MCFPLLSCIPRNVFVEHTVLQGCVNRAIAYILGILCTEGTNAVCGDGGFGVVPRMQSPIPLFFNSPIQTLYKRFSQTESCQSTFMSEGLRSYRTYSSRPDGLAIPTQIPRTIIDTI